MTAHPAPIAAPQDLRRLRDALEAAFEGAWLRNFETVGYADGDGGTEAYQALDHEEIAGSVMPVVEKWLETLDHSPS